MDFPTEDSCTFAFANFGYGFTSCLPVDAGFAEERGAGWAVLQSNPGDHTVFDKVSNYLDRCMSHATVELFEREGFFGRTRHLFLMLNLVSLPPRPLHLPNLLTIRSSKDTPAMAE